MENNKAYISEYAIMKEKKEYKIASIGTSAIVASVILASNPGASTYAQESGVQSIEISNQDSLSQTYFSLDTQPEKNVSLSENIMVETKNGEIEVTAEIKKAANELASLINEQHDLSNVSSFEVITNPSEALSFDPIAEGFGELKVNGNVLVSEVTKEEEISFKNTIIHPLAKDSYTPTNDVFGADENGNFHHGEDFQVSKDTPMYSVANGTVIYSGEANGYGNWIVLEHVIKGETIYSIYGHMSADNLFVKEGETVKQGQVISLVGNEGNADGKELHFAIAKDRDVNEGRVFYNYINPQSLIDASASESFEYEEFIVEKEIEISEEPYTVNDYWKYANEAAEIVNWDPYLIMSQWQLESSHFTSNNFITNNNLAGQTWHAGYPEEMKGSARPANEGGYYIKYSDPVEGYVDFIEGNPRYSDVQNKGTAEEQAREIKNAGWAIDPEYAEKLISMIAKNRENFTISDVVVESTTEVLAQEVASPSSLNDYQLGEDLFAVKGTDLIQDKIKNGSEYVLADLTDKTRNLIKNSLSSPVDTNKDGYISSDFGWRDIGDGQEFHKGMDFAAATGTNIYAPKDGVVVWAGDAPIDSYGSLVVVEHSISDEDGKKLVFYTSYAHMQISSISVAIGDIVKAGQKIAEVGNEGRSTGSHLHFATHFGFDEIGNLFDLVDPALLLQDGNVSNEVLSVTTDVMESEFVENEEITETEVTIVTENELTEVAPIIGTTLIESIIDNKDNEMEVEEIELPFILEQLFQ